MYRIILTGSLLLLSVLPRQMTRAADAAPPRTVLSLDGTWQIEQGKMDSAPTELLHTVVVPGLVDMAQPPFTEVGKKSEQRQAFWYQRTFTVDGPIPEIALLKIRKANWGIKVFLNDQVVGEHLPCFTPAVFDVKPFLKGSGTINTLVIRVGADRESLPEGVPSGWDFEKYLFIPGIFDSMELILTGAPYVANIQTVPNVLGKSVRVVAEIQAGTNACDVAPQVEVAEAAGGKAVGSVMADAIRLAAGEMKKIDVTIPLSDCRLWSPEDPFLYVVRVTTNGDSFNARFGMRSFRCDPATGRMVLNEKPYYMRGTNVTAYRFFEDADRGDLPWRAEWVRKLHQKYKGMHWNSIRYCVGFPPDFWYDIADEEGFLIQDEFPIFLGTKNDNAPDHPSADETARQYAEWMRERWNHPCVVIWDAQNESHRTELGQAIAAVRGLDLSNRPWDNGFDGAPTPSDCVEAHPYLFGRWCSVWGQGSPFHLKDLATVAPVPWLTPEQQKNMPIPIIINEYCWLWLNRDGSPTIYTKDVYDGLLGKESTVDQRRQLHARYLAALTEFWRSRRTAAGVLHFCGLGYSRANGKPRPEGGATSDDFVDIRNLTFDPYYEQYVRDSFAPVGVMIDDWAETYQSGPHEFPVIVVNDLYDAWKGTIRLRILRDGETIAEKLQPGEVPALGKAAFNCSIEIPSQPSAYQVEMALIGPGEEIVRSLRDFAVPADQK